MALDSLRSANFAAAVQTDWDQVCILHTLCALQEQTRPHVRVLRLLGLRKSKLRGS